jgi:hypothetical protein
LEAEKPTEATSRPTTQVLAPTEESDVEVIEAPLAKKRKLKKVAEPVAPIIEQATPVVEQAALMVEPTALGVKVVNVAGFLAAQRKQMPSPSVPRMADVEAFLANEPVLAVLMNGVELIVEEPLQAPEGPIPSILNQPLG